MSPGPRLRPSRWILAALATASALAAAAPTATAFEIFGIRLWGREQESDDFEIIDPVPYTVTFEVRGGGDDLQRLLERASGLWTERETPASGATGLLSRARGDYRRILAALYNNAYYGGEISILLAGREAADLALDSPMPAEVPVTIRVRAGPRFHFGEARIVNAPPPNPRRDDERTETIAEAFSPGARANAGAINAASTDAVDRWRHLARPKARESGREVVADHATNLLDAVIVLEPGREARFGRTSVTGGGRVNPGFVAYMADLPQGGRFDPDRVQAAQDRLARLGVFSSIRIEEAPEIAPDGTLDMTVAVADGPARTIGFGATLGTIEGLGVEAYWEHRNLLGRAERLRFEASVASLGVTNSPDEFDYQGAIRFTRPGVINPHTDFISALVARRLDLDAYREQSISASVGLQRTFARGINGEFSLVGTKARFTDVFGHRDFLMLGPLARGDYDRRNDPLNATRGYYLEAEATPFYEAEYGNVAARGYLEGRIYRGLDDDERFVLAFRSKVGVYSGPDERESPPDQLFFAGGAGSVRGYAYRSIGIDVTKSGGGEGVGGGRSLVEGSGEARLRLTERWGGVAFVDAGYVFSSSTFGGDDSDLRAGAGLGARFFTGLGPLRVDLATPLDRRKDDDAFAVYIGIGQAF